MESEADVIVVGCLIGVFSGICESKKQYTPSSVIVRNEHCTGYVPCSHDIVSISNDFKYGDGYCVRNENERLKWDDKPWV